MQGLPALWPPLRVSGLRRGHFFHPRYNPNMQESDLEKTHQGLNLAILTLEEFHAKPQFLYLFGKSNTDTTEMWKRANESIYK